jgi:hypothetical protein
MINLRKVTAVTATAVIAFCASPAPETRLGFSFMADANAIVGAPLTPVSVAGVARRTAYRSAAVATSTAAAQSSAQAATAQQQSATAQQQSATAQQQSATAQQQAAAAQPAQVASSPAASTASGQALPIGTVVGALPAGCTQTTSGGVQYSKCGANYYRAAFQGNNLVYVTAQP